MFKLNFNSYSLYFFFFLQENEAKKWEKKESNGPHLTTASISVRALIEEKIIQKRSTALNGVAKLSPIAQAALKSKLRQGETVSPKTSKSMYCTVPA